MLSLTLAKVNYYECYHAMKNRIFGCWGSCQWSRKKHSQINLQFQLNDKHFIFLLSMHWS